MIEVKQGDTREWIRARLTIVTGGVAVPVNLAGTMVTFSLTDKVTGLPVVVEDAADGRVIIPLTSDMVDEVGSFRGLLCVEWSDGGRLHFPGGRSFITVRVHPGVEV